MQLDQKTALIKQSFLEAGFLSIGIARPTKLEEEARRLQEWLDLGYHGKMSYMENHFDKRTSPEELLPGTKSIICLAYNYHTDLKQKPDAPKLASYAFGRDYHKVIKKRIKHVIRDLQESIGEFNYRPFVDSAPVMERDLAKRAGLGWIGKNTLLIHPQKGSYFFLAEVFVDFELAYDTPMRDYCGTCTRCIDACPTDAIAEEGFVLDASKCISYLTIELKDEEIPSEFQGKMEDWMFGCDICQDVCPWNRFSSNNSEAEFHPSERLLALNRKDWQELTEDEFNELFHGSAVKRTGYSGLKRNISFLGE